MNIILIILTFVTIITGIFVVRDYYVRKKEKLIKQQKKRKSLRQ